ncbi:MAG: BMP family ABC transporter substrate-binding protein [Selenomonas sp.]|nr:BMP family ABC transporter substrate-binding protein [Selenomonas sp.]
MNRNVIPWQHVILAAAFLALAAFVYFFCTADMQSQRAIKVGLVLPPERAEQKWYQEATTGLQDATQEIGASLLVEENVPDDWRGMDAIDRLHKEDASVIVSSGYGYGELFRAAGQAYPTTDFYTIMPYQNEGNIRTYFVRIYQLRYLQGMLEGMKTKIGRIGYLSYPRVPDNVQELDAFALGVRRVNPDARVFATFLPLPSGPDYDPEADAIAATERLVKNAGVDVLASHRENDVVSEYAIANGIDTLASYDDLPDDPHLLSRQSIDWKMVWSELLKDDIRRSNPRAFYWFGFDRAGMKFTIVSPDVTPEERARIEQAEASFGRGFEPFSGLIRDNEGNIRCREDESVSDLQLRQSINWLVEGVIVYEE